MEGLTSGDRSNVKSLLMKQINETRDSSTTAVRDLYQTELQSRSANAQALKDSSEIMATQAAQKQQELAKEQTARQERELRQSIEDDKRSLAQQSSALNRSRGRKVRVTNETDQQRPL